MKLGILGGGQLAKMLALSGYPLGVKTLCLEPNEGTCATEVTQVINALLSDEAALDAFVNEVDCVTIETENIPLNCAEYIAAKKPFFPSVKALQVCQDRLLEKRFLQELAIPTAKYLSVQSYDELNQAAAETGTPAFLKSRRMGYDGKGQYLLRSQEDIKPAWDSLDSDALILEQKVPFDYELSLIAVRTLDQSVSFYPLIKNRHVNSILHCSEAPFASEALQQQAQQYALTILQALDYVGVLTIEFFCCEDKLIVNELAPRVHNSGHLTIEGAQTSQFENHLRAIFGLPLGSTMFITDCFMVNCLGTMPENKAALSIPGVHLHQYGKSPRPNRKLGHITLTDNDRERFAQNKQRLCALVDCC